MSVSDFERLTQAISEIRFFDLPDVIGPGVEDAEQVVVTVTTAQNAKTVTTYDLHDQPTAPFAALVTLVDGVAAKLPWENLNQPKGGIIGPVPLLRVEPQYNLPWDGGTPSLQTGRSVRDQMIAAGRRVKVMPQLSVQQGIQAARTIFGKCFFDAEKCFDGIQAMRHYRYEVDENKSDPAGKHISLSKVPVHDWASHPADTFRTAAVMIGEPERKKETEKRRPSGKLSPWS